MHKDKIQEELENSKDPMKTLVSFIVEHIDDSTKAHKELLDAVNSLEKKLQPTIDAFNASQFIRGAGGWILVFIGGVIMVWNYVLQHTKDVIR